MAKVIHTPKSYKFTDELFESICTGIGTSSKGLATICTEHDISEVAFYAWIKKDPELLKRYTRAREDQADLLADEIISIADDGKKDTIQVEGKNGKLIDVEDKEWTSRSKLRVEARKWVAAKLKPKKYGDKVEISGNPDAPIQVITGQVVK